MGGSTHDQQANTQTSVTVELIDDTDTADGGAAIDMRAQRNSVALTLMAVSVVCLLAITLTIARTNRPPSDAQVEVPPVETPEASTAIAPSISEVTKPAVSYVEPDREVEIFLTERDTLIRVEPWTGRIIWESRPFTEPGLVSVDLNTVTLESRGNRLVISLTDGTLLPP